MWRPAEAGVVGGGRVRRSAEAVPAHSKTSTRTEQMFDQGKGLDGGGCKFWGEETMREHGISVLRARGRAQCWLETKARATGLEAKVGS